MPPATRQRQAKRPQDYTGRERDRLAAEHAEETKRRAEEVAMVTQAEAEAAENEVTDLTTPTPAPQAPQEPSGPVEVRKPHRVIRVNSDLEDMTYGHGNTYNFKAGQQYKVPADVANHLDRLGFVWH
jgi:hypothetical protein